MRAMGSSLPLVQACRAPGLHPSRASRLQIQSLYSPSSLIAAGVESAHSCTLLARPGSYNGSLSVPFRQATRLKVTMALIHQGRRQFCRSRSRQSNTRNSAAARGYFVEGATVESLDDYVKGGLCPMYIHQSIGKDQRYRIVHKLGNGTQHLVWLCRDTKTESYVAIKVLAADVAREDVPDLKLCKVDRERPGSARLPIPMDVFEIPSPNGIHQCVVLPLLGPRFEPGLLSRPSEDQGLLLRGIARQVTEGLACLHAHGICHGDLRPENIYLVPKDLDALSEDEVYEMLGRPDMLIVEHKYRDHVSTSVPDYLIPRADLKKLGSIHLSSNICLIDYSSAFAIDLPPAEPKAPREYLPPEVLLEQRDASTILGRATDLWALGCTLFEIREQDQLVDNSEDPDETVFNIITLLGILPDKLWETFYERDDFFCCDEEGRYLIDYKDDWILLDSYLRESNQSQGKVNHPDPSHWQHGKEPGLRGRATLPAPERELFIDLLLSLLSYEPTKRATAEQTLSHSWFKLWAELNEIPGGLRTY